MLELSDSVNRKFVDSIELDDCWEIETDSGWSPITHVHKTIQYQEFILKTESGKELICADDHIIFDDNMSQIFVKDCIPGLTKIYTRDGIEVVSDIISTDTYSNMYDVTVTDKNHRFWSGDILSHNSTILDAITYVLYGKPFRKINKPQLINTTNNGDLFVELEFETPSNSYVVKRGMKPNIFEIYENDKLINQDAANRDYQDILENHILKMSYKTFTQIVVIGNATYMPFMKLQPGDRRQIVDNLLDIDIYSKMNVILKNRISETKELISDTNYKVDLSKEKMKMYSNLLQDGSTNIDKQIESNKADILRNEIQIDSKRKTIEKIQEEISQITINESKIKTLNSKISEMNKYSATFKEKIKLIKKDMSFFENTSNCPTCTQSIPDDFKSKNLEVKQKEHIKYVDALESCNIQIQTIREELDSIMSNMEEISKRNDIIKERSFEIDSLQKYIDNIKNQNNSLLNQKMEDMAKAKEEYSALEKENEDLSLQRDTLLNTQHLHSIATILLKDDGIKTKVIRHYLPIMNKIINKYLHMMDFYVSFTLDENFNEVIKNKAKENFSYHSFSEGEKLRIDLAILFTWREIAKMKNAANTNLLILDEIFDSSLDASGVDEFLKILNSNKEHTNTFVISHKTEFLVDKFERIYKFYKVNGFTKVAIES